MPEISDRCRRCHRTLKDMKSMTKGIGPKCAKKEATEIAAEENKRIEKAQVKIWDLIGGGTK